MNENKKNENKKEMLRIIGASLLTLGVLYLIRNGLSGWWLLIQGYFLFVFFYVVINPDTSPGRYFR